MRKLRGQERVGGRRIWPSRTPLIQNKVRRHAAKILMRARRIGGIGGEEIKKRRTRWRPLKKTGGILDQHEDENKRRSILTGGKLFFRDAKVDHRGREREVNWAGRRNRFNAIMQTGI